MKKQTFALFLGIVVTITACAAAVRDLKKVVKNCGMEFILKGAKNDGPGKFKTLTVRNNDHRSADFSVNLDRDCNGKYESNVDGVIYDGWIGGNTTREEDIGDIPGDSCILTSVIYAETVESASEDESGDGDTFHAECRDVESRLGKIPYTATMCGPNGDCWEEEGISDEEMADYPAEVTDTADENN